MIDHDFGLLSHEQLGAWVKQQKDELAALRVRLAAAEERERAFREVVSIIAWRWQTLPTACSLVRGMGQELLAALAAPAQPAAPSPGLTWTSEPPKVPGRYLFWSRGDDICRQARLDDDDIKTGVWGKGWRWYGPLPEPQEPADAGGGGE